jgi:hypothetical protein
MCITTTHEQTLLLKICFYKHTERLKPGVLNLFWTQGHIHSFILLWVGTFYNNTI